MIYCNDLKYNGKLYNVFYDKETKLLRFYYEGKEENVDYLNNLYNKKKSVLQGYNKLITILLGLAVFTGSYLAMNIAEDVYINELYSDDNSYTQEYIDVNSYTNEEFLAALKEANPELEEYIDLTQDVILKYGNYINKSHILNSIGGMDVIHTSNKTEMIKDNAIAFYSKDENKIYVSDNIEDEDTENICLYHEFLHYYSQSGLYDYNDYGDGYMGYALNEGLTEIINAELNGRFLYTYHKEASYIQALCEIIDPEVLLKAYFGNSIEYLIDEMSTYCTEDEAISLIKNIDVAKDSYTSYSNTGNIEDYENFESANEKAWEVLDNMYFSKYRSNMMDDRYMAALKTATCLENYADFDLSPYDNPVILDVMIEKNCFTENASDEIIIDYLVQDGEDRSYDICIITENSRHLSKNEIKK